jgi:hypothetical protein
MGLMKPLIVIVVIFALLAGVLVLASSGKQAKPNPVCNYGGACFGSEPVQEPPLKGVKSPQPGNG